MWKGWFSCILKIKINPKYLAAFHESTSGFTVELDTMRIIFELVFIQIGKYSSGYQGLISSNTDAVSLLSPPSKKQ